MKAKLRRSHLWLISVFGLVALYAALGFFLVPVIARKQIEKNGSTQLGREVTLQRVRFNPFTFAGSLEGFRVKGGAEGDLGSWEILRFNFDPGESLFRQEWRFGQLSLVAPSFHLQIDQEGRLNIADIVSRNQNNAKDESSSPPKVGIDRLSVQNGSVEFTDRSRETPFESTAHPIDFVLENFSTAKQAGGTYRLSGKTAADESFAWAGNISVAPVASRGEVKFEGIQLSKYMPFAQPFLAGEISDGRLNLSAKYDLELGPQTGSQPKAIITDLAVRLTGLAIRLPQAAQPAVALTSVELDAPQINPIARTAQVARVAVDGLAVELTRESDGRFDLASLVRTPAAGQGASATTGQEAEQPFAVTVDTVTLANGAVNFTDRTLPQPVPLRADQIHFTASGFGPALDKPVAIDLGLRIQNGPGQLTAKGTVQPQPLLAEVDLTGSELQVATAAAYLKSFADVQIASGAAQFNGHLRASQAEGSPLALQWSGSAAVENLGVTGSDAAQPLVSWTRVGVTGVNADLAARELQIEEVQINGPAALVLMKEDGSLNFATLIKSNPTAKEGAGTESAQPANPDVKEPAASASPFSIAIASVSISDGSITFRDLSTKPVPEAKITAIGGTVTNLSTQANASGQIDLTATVLQSPPSSLKGKANPLGKDPFAGSDLALEMKGVRLEALEPYAMKYLGYKIQKGRMEGDFEYKLSGQALDGKNRVVLDNFYLGEAVQSPDAMSLPIKLALAVMRNRDGKVILEVPVSGTITSPQFSFANAISHAFQNALAKVASAPFAMLGSLFGGAPDADLSQVSFPGGTAEITEDAKRNLDTLARALQERPSLQLTLRWVPAPEQDRLALATQQIRTLVAEKKRQLSSAEQTVSDDHALVALYQERVHPTTMEPGKEPEQALASPSPDPNMSASATAPERRPAWYVRFYRFFFRSDKGASGTAVATSRGGESSQPAIDPPRMQQELAATIEVDPQAFAGLARSRAEAAREYLKQSGVDLTRLQVAPDPGAPEGQPADGPRVYFTLDEKPPESAASGN